MHASVQSAGSRRLGRWGRKLMLAGVAALGLALVGCPATKMEEELKAEVKAVKAEVQTLKDKLAALEAGQKDIMAAVQKLQAAPPPKEAPPAGTVVIPPPGSPLAPGAPGALRPETAAGVLTVGELIKNKDRYLGSRVTVKGEPGPVLVHKRLFHLRAPEGMVEVIFANLGDKAQIERLTSQVLPTEIKVTGTLVQASGQGPSRLQITAESVEF